MIRMKMGYAYDIYIVEAPASLTDSHLSAFSAIDEQTASVKSGHK